jgi:hypothetical protein
MPNQRTKNKKVVAGEVTVELFKKLERIATSLQRTKSDLVGSIVANWLIAIDEAPFLSHANFTKNVGLMPPPESKA